jgi:hypothetical protein
MKKKSNPKTKSRPWWKWTKRIVLGLFLAQLFYIIILRWVDPPVTLTQLGAWVSGDGLKRDYVDYDEMAYHMKLWLRLEEHRQGDEVQRKEAGTCARGQYHKPAGGQERVPVAGPQLDP